MTWILPTPAGVAAPRSISLDDPPVPVQIAHRARDARGRLGQAASHVNALIRACPEEIDDRVNELGVWSSVSPAPSGLRAALAQLSQTDGAVIVLKMVPGDRRAAATAQLAVRLRGAAAHIAFATPATSLTRRSPAQPTLQSWSDTAVPAPLFNRNASPLPGVRRTHVRPGAEQDPSGRHVLRIGDCRAST